MSKKNGKEKNQIENNNTTEILNFLQFILQRDQLISLGFTPSKREILEKFEVIKPGGRGGGEGGGGEKWGSGFGLKVKTKNLLRKSLLFPLFTPE